MNVKQPSLRGLNASFVALATVLGVILGSAASLSASPRRQNAADQEKDRKEEKKDEKKDEKKGLPLKSDRKVEFTTDEGTWLSLDVSPDGKTIVFELVGDIYTLPIEGGQAKLIDGGMSFDSQPKFRSEEHTSELQSQSNLVCRLLLEKKKKTCSTHESVSQLHQPFGLLLR